MIPGDQQVRGIFKELEKRGRNPRGEFKTATLADSVEEIADLRAVTNVTNFGAAVDIGVCHDGLVHIPCLSEFVEDPRQVVTTGDVVKVKVPEVNAIRCRYQ
ncbi:S1 RNA-binding domain-containing protein [Aggregatibacter actinomycetemcomitans]|nr:S1 RNA-binding domain-containing protein [Aggregatibacter actinomycetemcomitans]